MAERKFIKPKMVKITGQSSPTLARLQFKGTGRELPADGAWVRWVGNEGNFWRRRVADGEAEVADPGYDDHGDTTENEV